MNSGKHLHIPRFRTRSGKDLQHKARGVVHIKRNRGTIEQAELQSGVGSIHGTHYNPLPNSAHWHFTKQTFCSWQPCLRFSYEAQVLGHSSSLERLKRHCSFHMLSAATIWKVTEVNVHIVVQVLVLHIILAPHIGRSAVSEARMDLLIMMSR